MGTDNGTMLVIAHKQIIKTFNAWDCQSVILNSIVFDQFGNMAVASEYGQLYFYNTNSNYLNKNILAYVFAHSSHIWTT